MWIVYVGIAVFTYAVSNGFYYGSVGSVIITLVALGSIGSIIYSVYPYTPLGIMMASVKKQVDKEYTEHRQSLFSKHNRNNITYCIVFLLLILSFRLPKLIEPLLEQFYFDESAFISVALLLMGIGVYAVFLFKYKSLPRSERRELEFLDAESEIAFIDKMNEYQQHQRKNPQYKNITYLGGYHKKTRVNAYGILKLEGDILSMYSTYYEKTLFNIPVSEIISIKYEQIEDNSYNRSMYYYINLMYIEYVSEGKQHTLRFKLGKNVRYELEHRIKQMNANRKPPKVNPQHPDETDINDANDNNSENIPQDIKETIKEKYESIEERLERLKYFMDKGLITEQEYQNRKQEIIKEI